ncbi:host attachment protein [Candidatus Uhrbacteria bacterium]|nr:host attachment protein [Candidatus Uhrbacteria bacterium]
MQISQDFLPYEHKTLILVCDNAHAKLYQAFGREFNFVEEIKNDRIKLDDIERYATQTGGGILSKIEDEDFKEREAKTFYKKLAQMLSDRKDAEEWKLILVVPQEDKNVILDLLQNDVKQSLVHVIEKQPPKLPDDQLIKFIDNERRIT